MPTLTRSQYCDDLIVTRLIHLPEVLVVGMRPLPMGRGPQRYISASNGDAHQILLDGGIYGRAAQSQSVISREQPRMLLAARACLLVISQRHSHIRSIGFNAHVLHGALHFLLVGAKVLHS